MSTNLLWDNPLVADGDLLCERETGNQEFTQSTGHSYQEVIEGTPAANCWACA